MGYPNAVLEAARNGTLCPFIGSGFSRAFGYPGWTDFLKSIAEDKNIAVKWSCDLAKADHLVVAEALHRQFTTKSWCEVKQQLERAGKDAELSDVHRELNRQFGELCMSKMSPCASQRDEKEVGTLKRLPDLRPAYIVTTNYDRVIEGEIYGKGNIVPVWRGKEWKPRPAVSAPTLLKIHGDVEDAQSIILTHSQYYDFVHGAGYLNSRIYSLFVDRTVLFLGYGFRDVTVHTIYTRYLREFGDIWKQEKDAYMAVDKEREKERLGSMYPLWLKFLKNKRIRPVEYSGTLGGFVAGLADHIGSI